MLSHIDFSVPGTMRCITLKGKPLVTFMLMFL